MSRHIGRREALIALCGFPVLAALSGCDSPVGKKAVKIVVVVAKRLFKVTSVAVDLYQLVMEIKAVIDGTDETVTVKLTQEQANSLKAGGELVIQDADGKKTLVSYSTK